MTMTLDGSAGMTAPQGAVYNGLARGTAQNPSASTNIDFTDIPIWVRRITVLVSSLSSSTTSPFIARFGSGTFQTTGYASIGVPTQSAAINSSVSNSTTGFDLYSFPNEGAATFTGVAQFYNITGLTWIQTSLLNNVNGSRGCPYTGSVTLSGTLDRIRFTSISGSNAFTGTINIMYE